MKFIASACFLQFCAVALGLASCVGSFAVVADAPNRAGLLWATLPGTLRSAAGWYGGSQAALSAEVSGDALAVALSSLAAAALALALGCLHSGALLRHRAAWRRAHMLAASAGSVADAPPRFGWWRVAPSAGEVDTQYAQLLHGSMASRAARYCFCCSGGGGGGPLPLLPCSIPDVCGICSVRGVDSLDSLCSCLPWCAQRQARRVFLQQQQNQQRALRLQQQQIPGPATASVPQPQGGNIV